METNQREWSTVLRQAVIRLKPDYFALPEIERDAYRLHLTSEDDFRIRHFVRDSRCIAGDPAEVDNLIEQEKHLALDFLANTYKDIMDNFDPTIVLSS